MDTKLNGKKILVIGGTGSMGSYLVPELLARGYAVDVFALDKPTFEHPALNAFTGDCRDLATLRRVLSGSYDGIIDFLNYDVREYTERHRMFLETGAHYIFLSSYRVYTDLDPVTTETSPRHADVSPDEEFRRSGDYSIYKAQDEDILRASGCDNFTIVRPSIVFSRLSFPLVSLGACSIVNRARDGKPTIIPDEAVNVQGTATWSGDLAKMYAGILCNRNCYGEAYTFATSEHLSWGTVASYYRDLLGLHTLTVPLEDYKEVYGMHSKWSVWQIDYDRMLNRVMDNTKILKAAGLSASDLTPVYTAFERELSAIPKEYRFPDVFGVNDRMDAYLKNGGKIVRELY